MELEKKTVYHSILSKIERLEKMLDGSPSFILKNLNLTGEIDFSDQKIVQLAKKEFEYCIDGNLTTIFGEKDFQILNKLYKELTKR